MDAEGIDRSAWPAGHRPRNVAALLRWQADRRGDAVAISDAERSLTWSQLDREVDRLASGLVRLGLVAGYRVGLVLGNRVELVTGYLATLRAGLVAVPLNAGSSTGEVIRLLADSGCRVVLCETSTVTTVRGAVAGLADALVGADEELRARSVVPRLVCVGGPVVPGEERYDDLMAAEAEPELAVPPRDAETLAVLLYTSGTGGRPRGVMLTHRALLANIDQVATLRLADRPDDVTLGVVPLFHVYGLNAVLGQVLRHGSRLVLERRFEPESTLELVRRESVTYLPVAPPMLEAWAGLPRLTERLSGVRTMLCGAGPLTADFVSRFERASGLRVERGYGLTEAAPVVTATLASHQRKPGSVGAPLPGVELRVLREDAPADPGDTGEIVVRGDNLFSGYWPEGAGGPDGEGWFPTGDVGYRDDDGDLFLVDRIEEIVVVSGFNAYPSEIEEVVTELDGVAEAAVIGVPDPDTGQAVVAYVVPDTGAGLDEQTLRERIHAHCEDRLARFKRPRDVYLVPELRRGVAGSVAKGRLRATEQRRRMGLA